MPHHVKLNITIDSGNSVFDEMPIFVLISYAQKSLTRIVAKLADNGSVNGPIMDKNGNAIGTVSASIEVTE